MDIDQSIQSRAVNYMNRPRPNDRFMGKRPTEQHTSQNPKIQRNFNIETECEENYNEFETDYYKVMASYEAEEDLEPIQQYIDQQEPHESEHQVDPIGDQEFADIHFLE